MRDVRNHRVYCHRSIGPRHPARRNSRRNAKDLVANGRSCTRICHAPYRFLYFITKPRGDQAVLEFLKGRINNSLGILDKRLSSRAYLLGSEPTIADVSLISYLYYPPEEFGFDIAAEYKNIAAWLGRIKALPGWAHPYDLMPDHPLAR